MTTEVAPCPYDTAIEDRDPPSVRRALGELQDWWDILVLASPAQTAAAETVVQAVAAWRALEPLLPPHDTARWLSVVSNSLLDTVELARRTLHVVCAGRP